MDARENFLLESDELPLQVDAVCRTVTPHWPLDQQIAVNPLWGLIDLPFADLAGQLAALADSGLFMPREYYWQQWQAGQIDRQDLDAARAEQGYSGTGDALLAWCQQAQPQVKPLVLLSDRCDDQHAPGHAPDWRVALTQQISQFCAAWFDDGEADWRVPHQRSLYAGWRQSMCHDHNMSVLMNVPWLSARARALPDEPMLLIRQGLARLAIPREHTQRYLQALLWRISGWASWCAYLDRHAAQPDTLRSLLAIRLAWECLLDDGCRDHASLWQDWQRHWQAKQTCRTEAELLIWQRALELAHVRPLLAALQQRVPPTGGQAPSLQAVFCIDVRSEPMRRALEAQLPGSQTCGFAGFFGLPMAYAPLATEAWRPQLPGLLTASARVTDSAAAPEETARLAARRRRRLQWHRLGASFSRQPASAFSMVETLGLGYAWKLLRQAMNRVRDGAQPDQLGLRADEYAGLCPDLTRSGQSLETLAELAGAILKAMGIAGNLGRTVLLVGHDSLSCNNPHAASLACGACGGQGGAVNARALARLLNRRDIRQLLTARGLPIADDCCFLAALHNTATEALSLLPLPDLPAAVQAELPKLQQALDRASAQVRQARSQRQPLPGMPQSGQADDWARRAARWSQTRPEWGLAGNASLIVAPRWLSRDMDLQGQSFLHDYDWQQDPDGQRLEQIMTAPMIVSHWINLQYYASTVDNQRFGSGNKLLHNVVGGHIGVFEGNAGDLRIGLARQSLHDGERWVHVPRRLAVIIQAPPARIEAILQRHRSLQQLVEHQWLWLYALNPEDNAIQLRQAGDWCVLAG